METERSQQGSDYDPGEDADASPGGVKMIAVFRGDGEIMDFVKAPNQQEMIDETLDGSSDELASVILKGGNNPGSAAWMSHTIGKLKGTPTSAHSGICGSNNAAVEHTEEAPSTVRDKIMRLGMEMHQKSNQLQLADLNIQETILRRDYNDSNSASLYYGCNSHGSTSLNTEGASEAQNPNVKEPSLTRQEIEDNIRDTVSISIMAFKEEQDAELKKMYEEQDLIYQEKLDKLMENVKISIDDSFSQLQSSHMLMLQEKVDKGALAEAINDSIEIAKTSMQEALKNEIEKTKKEICQVTEKLEHTTGAIKEVENKIGTFSNTLANTDKALQELTCRVDVMKSSFQKAVDESTSEIKQQVKNIDVLVSGIETRLVSREEQLDELARSVANIKAQVGGVDEKIEKQSIAILDKVNNDVDERLFDLENRIDIDGALQHVTDLCDQLKNTVPDIVSQELEGRMEMLTMDMEDKFSQDIHRNIDGRMQIFTSMATKNIENAVELKLCSADAGPIKNAIWKMVESSVLNLVTKKIDTLTGHLKEEVSRIQECMENNIKYTMDENEKRTEESKAELVDTMSVHMKDVNEKLEQVNELSTAIEDQMTVLSGLLEESRKHAEHLKQSKKYFEEEVPSIISQMKESAVAYTKMMEISRQIPAELANVNREALNASVKEPNNIVNEMKNTNDRHHRILLPATSCHVPSNSFAHLNQGSSIYDTTTIPTVYASALQHPYTLSGNSTYKTQPNVFCGASFPDLRSEIQNNFCSLVPRDYLPTNSHRDGVFMSTSSPRVDPCKRLEVKYVEMNGHLVKVTQERYKLNEAANIHSTVLQGGYISPNETQHNPRLYY